MLFGRDALSKMKMGAFLKAGEIRLSRLKPIQFLLAIKDGNFKHKIVQV